VASRSSEVNFTKNYTLLYLFYNVAGQVSYKQIYANYVVYYTLLSSRLLDFKFVVQFLHHSCNL